MPKGKVTVEERIETAKACAEGRMSQSEAARRLGISKPRVTEWVARYRSRGELAFKAQEGNAVYTEEVKISAVREYMEGNGSLNSISAKYGLRSKTQLESWIKVYNSGKDFGRKMSGGSRMKQGRGTTQEERIAIVKECLENGSNYEAPFLRHLPFHVRQGNLARNSLT